MKRYVRWGRANTSVDECCGLVHFWPPRGQAAKLQAMTDYMRALEAAGDTGSKLP
jgi:hypothetical protein